MGDKLLNSTVTEMVAVIEARNLLSVELTSAKFDLGAPDTTADALDVDAETRVAAATKQFAFDLPESIYIPLSEAASFTPATAERPRSKYGFLSEPGGFFTSLRDVAPAPAVD